ncbi:MAG: zinc-binding dehydrogenase, partial [Pseudomonadota bacterium]
PSVHKRVRELFPKGIDVVFENVGGDIFEASIWNLAFNARIALCGMIADYNAPPEEMPPGPRGLAMLIGRSARMQGFIVANYPELMRDWVQLGARWLGEGKLSYRETVVEGIENAPDAFIGMLKGDNFGKQIVRLGDD